jgi:hypothetical protein
METKPKSNEDRRQNPCRFGMQNKHIKIVSDLAYSARHNEGDGAEKRQFMGESVVLNKVSKKIIIEELNKIFLL